MESRSPESRSLRYAPFVQPRSRGRATPIPEGAADPPADDDLPQIDQFLDELPAIEDYLEEEPAPDERASGEWAVAEWQAYDWGSLAQLGRPASGAASPDEGWDAGLWPSGDEHRLHEKGSAGGSPVTGTGGGPGAAEVAAALDEIAKRIRSGELPIDQFRGSPPESAMAAVVAAMLRMRG